MERVRNRNFINTGGPNSIIDWDMSILFGGVVVSAPGEPTRIGAALPGQTVYKAQQSNIVIPAGWYRVYFNVESNFPAWDLGFMIGSTETWLIGGSATELKDNGYFDIAFTDAFPPDNTISVLFGAASDLYEFTVHLIDLCPLPEFEWSKSFNFQLPLYEIGDNLIPQQIPLTLHFSDAHIGGVTESATNGPPYAPSANIKDWDFPYLEYPVGYVGNLFFKYEIGSGNVVWGLAPFTSNPKPKSVGLTFFNSVGTCEGLAPGFAHQTILTPSESLKGCFISDINATTPIAVISGGVCIVTSFEEDVTVVPSIGRVDYEFNDIETELFLMTTTESFVADDDKFYRLKFRNNNTTKTTLIIKDSAGTTIFADVAESLDYQCIFFTGLLPIDKTIFIEFSFEDVLTCDDDDFYINMLSGVSLIEVDKWKAQLNDFAPCGGEYYEDIAVEHASKPVVTGENYSQNVLYTIPVNLLIPGCYNVEIEGVRITDKLISKYYSNCLKVCDVTPDLNYFSWNPRNNICIGGEILDYENYSKDDEDYNSYQHFWIKSDLQDLQINDERNVYKQSNGFSINYYSEQFNDYILQIWSFPEYARRALAVALATGPFKINGRTFQKLDDEVIAPQFAANPNSPIRINVREIGDFVISKNIIKC